MLPPIPQLSVGQSEYKEGAVHPTFDVSRSQDVQPWCRLDFFGSRLLFLRQHWQSESAVGRLLQQAFECFQMDTELDGNTFNRSFSTLGHLSSHSWFKSLWEFCNYYSVDFSFAEDMNINTLQEGDMALLERFLLWGVFSMEQMDIKPSKEVQKGSLPIRDPSL